MGFTAGLVGTGSPDDELLACFGVLPLNNPPYYPRYNGAKEKSIQDLKTALAVTMQLE